MFYVLRPQVLFPATNGRNKSGNRHYSTPYAFGYTDCAGSIRVGGIGMTIQKLSGANMDIDLATRSDLIQWKQAHCPWNRADQTQPHRCAVKNVSICPYFCGVEYLDTLLCCYPHENPLKSK